MTSPERPTETRESDFDHEFKVSVFDYMIDQVLAGSISMEEGITAFNEVMHDAETLDGQPE